MNVALNPKIEKLVEQRVSSGDFTSPEQAVNELLGIMLEESVTSDEEIAELRDLIDEGIAELDRGEYVECTVQEIIADCHAAHRA
jgi:Arc/MetJ-type ribon-helix-helix transcriptional regulator